MVSIEDNIVSFLQFIYGTLDALTSWIKAMGIYDGGLHFLVPLAQRSHR